VPVSSSPLPESLPEPESVDPTEARAWSSEESSPPRSRSRPYRSSPPELERELLRIRCAERPYMQAIPRPTELDLDASERLLIPRRRFDPHSAHPDVRRQAQTSIPP
jgi:hypothetical protein